MTDEELLSIDLQSGDKDDSGIQCYQKQIVTTRKSHTCLFETPHEIPTGTKARRESGILDGKWKHFYVCSKCLEKWIEEWG